MRTGWVAIALLVAACESGDPAGPQSLPPQVAPGHGASDPPLRPEQIGSCGAAKPKSALDDVFAIIDADATNVDVPVCLFVMRRSRICAPSRCKISLEPVRGLEAWAGVMTATKAGDDIYDVVSNTGKQAVFFYSGPRARASISFRGAQIGGRVVDVWTPTDVHGPNATRDLDGAPARVIGRYSPTVMAKGARRTTNVDGSTPQTVAIQTEDTSIMLGVYWRADGLRDPAEIARFSGRDVVVVGTLHARTPTREDKDGEYQTMIGPYIDPIAIDLPGP